MSVMNIAEFETTPQIAAIALNYLMDQRPHVCTVRTYGQSEWFMGWGGRALVKTGSHYELKSFRRFEYRRFDLQRDDSVAVTVAFDSFRALALENRKEIKNEED